MCVSNQVRKSTKASLKNHVHLVYLPSAVRIKGVCVCVCLSDYVSNCLFKWACLRLFCHIGPINLALCCLQLSPVNPACMCLFALVHHNNLFFSLFLF